MTGVRDAAPASGRQLTGVDGFMWRTGREDRGLRWVICAAVLLESAPDWSRFKERWELLTRRVPVLRERPVHGTFGVSLPRLVPDPEFDLDLHLSRIALPEGGTWDDVMAEARRMSLTDFDGARPLWRAELVTGLPQGRAAVILAMHHAIADGQSAVLIGANLFTLDASDAGDGEAAERLWTGDAAPSRLTVSAANIGDNAARFGRLARTLAGGLRGAATDPAGALVRGREVLQSLDRIGPVDGPMLSPLMVGRGAGYSTATTTVPFDRMRAAARELGASVNEVFLAGIAEGAARYHQRHDRPAPRLRFSVPISLRETLRGARARNVVTIATVELPVSGADREQRLRVARERVRAWRAEPALALNQRLVELHWLVPVSRVAAGARALDISASNVAGPPVPLYLAGVRVLGMWPLVSTVGTAVNVTMISYDGTACLGVSADDRAVPDLTEFMADLDAGLAATVET